MSSLQSTTWSTKKSRRRHLAHDHLVYNTDELREIYNISANTVSNWIRLGLPTTRAEKNLFRGKDLNAFQAWQKRRRSYHVRPDEAYCFTCKEARSIYECDTRIIESQTAPQLELSCNECGRTARKFISHDQIEQIEKALTHKISGERLDYNVSSLPAEDCNLRDFEGAKFNASNVKTLYAYQKHLGAKGYNPKTILSAMAHVGSYEAFVTHSNLEKSTLDHVTRFKSHLFSRVTSKDQPISASTITHTLSSLKGFYQWMYEKHDGPQIAEYFVPDQRIKNAIYETKQRLIPTINEIERVVRSMPRDNFYALRNRAMVAFLLLSGVRIGALLSLRRKHINIAERSTFQDPSEVDTKNSKTIHVKWFPVPMLVETFFLEYWKAYNVITTDDDAPLFPKGYNWITLGPDARARVEPLRTPQNVRDIIKEACAAAEVSAFQPHQIRKTLAITRLQLNLTAKQNKAFSQNLGHERIETTDQHYSKLSRGEQFAAMDQIPRIGEEGSERDRLAALVRTEPELLLPALKAILEYAGSN